MKEQSSLPTWATRFLRIVCPAELFEEIEGDLIQRFNLRMAMRGRSVATLKLFLDIIQYTRPGIVLRHKIAANLFNMNLLGAHVKLAGRNLSKNKIISFINITGLAVSLTAFFYIIQYVAYETSFDRFHAHADRIYRVASEQYQNGTLKNSSAKNYPGIYRYLNENIPEVETATRFIKIPANTGFLFGHEGKIFNEGGGFINADTNFFKVFSRLLMRGNPHDALKNPNSIVISESIAKKIFGDRDPVGQRLDPIDDKSGTVLLITGILADIPQNAHFHANFVARLEDRWPEILKNDWLPSCVFNYVLLRPAAEASIVEEKLNTILKRISRDVPVVDGSVSVLQPLSTIHLQSHFDDEYESNGSSLLVYFLLGIGVTILIMSWINYVNIETARFLKRTKELGVRRIIGSGKFDLAMQFLVEYFCITAFAVVMAAGLIIMTLPTFNSLLGAPLDFSMLASTKISYAAMLFTFCGTIVTGAYPGLYLIGLNPARALTRNFNVDHGRGFVRKPLLIVQFSASIILIASLLVINAQLDFMQVTNKKIEVEKVIAVRNPVAYANKEVVEKYNHFKLLQEQLTQHASVAMVGTSSAIPGAEVGFTYVNLIKRTLNDPYDPTRYKTVFVGENFLQLYGIKLLAGRNFEMETEGEYIDPWKRKDWLKIIINEKAAKTLGFKSPQEAVNQIVKFKAFDDFEDHEIIGVVEDYHHEAASKDVLPMILKANFNSYQQVYYSIRLNAGVMPAAAIHDIQTAWEAVFPGYPFEYFFLDDYYDRQFKSERQFRSMFLFFAGVAIFIACLGVLGMALFESNARIKEISVRKVLGASTVSLLALLSRDQARCMLVSCLVSFPLIWYGADSWLSAYPLKVSLSPIILAVPAFAIAFIVTFLSCIQALKTVTSNPVNHLKSE